MTRTQATKDLLTKSGSALFNTFHLSSLTINLGAQNCLITSGCIEILDGPTETTNAILLKTFVHAEHSCNINDKHYKIHSNKYILTIIDYGNSSVKYRYKNKNRYISNVSMTNIGYFPFLIPGFDMYKFLCLSYMYCENYNKYSKTHEQMQKQKY